ncbi:MAG: hypothetical protein JSU07_00205 [Bacteroidetes bacterium]|nr:hypothetical protein [Bacteroidota bacterium]
MKNFKNQFLLLVVFSLNICLAQTPSFQELRSIIETTHPEISLNDKAIAFHVWSVADKSSREANIEFGKIGYTLQVAKIKNASKGLVVISCNTDNTSVGTIAFQRDSIKKAIFISKNDYTFLNNCSVNQNVIYDSFGNKLYQDLKVSAIFKSFADILTR